MLSDHFSASGSMASRVVAMPRAFRQSEQWEGIIWYPRASALWRIPASSHPGAPDYEGNHVVEL